MGRNVEGGLAFSGFRSTAVAFKWVTSGLISPPHPLLVVLISAFSAAPLGKSVHTFPLQTFLCLQGKGSSPHLPIIQETCDCRFLCRLSCLQHELKSFAAVLLLAHLKLALVTPARFCFLSHDI